MAGQREKQQQQIPAAPEKNKVSLIEEGITRSHASSHHLDSLTKDLTGDRLVLRWSTSTINLQEKGKTTLLPEIPTSNLLPCRNSCH
jgi:hypothetical protein